jgi:hypothetical protein
MEYTLTLTQQDVQIIINGLGELPLKVAANTFAKLQKQVAEQDDKNAVSLQPQG